MSLNQNIKDGLLASGSFLKTGSRNTPKQYKDRNTQYFEAETLKYISQYAKYSSDFFDCEAQGLEKDNPGSWIKARVRIADVVRPSASITRNFDDYKMILVESPHIDYIRPGTKFRTMGSTWLMVNPDNISSVSGSGMIRRCNAVWKHLDFYGNVCEEHICVENQRANANDPDSQETVVATKGYYQVIAQYNDFTKTLNDNTRLILGSKAYKITGYGDFEQEFTEEENSVRLLYFTIRFDEINDQTDDRKNKIADGKQLVWTAEINGAPETRIGAQVNFTATAKRNGEIVENTEEHPINFVWKSSDSSVAVVNASGTVTAISEGAAMITATLAENPSVQAVFELRVQPIYAQPKVIFTSNVPKSIPAYGEAIVSAAYFDGGEETAEPLTWRFEGADETAYSAMENGNETTIKCWHGSITPLVITAYHNGYAASAEIMLEGI